MTREDIKSCCKKISPGYGEDSVCDFADNVQTLGFIDTSQGQNGSRGIVFSTNHIMLNLDGSPRIIFYRNINSVRIIESYEDEYADEMEIICADEEFRINNCSLNKKELKSLLDKLCDGGLRGEGSARITPPPSPPKLPSASISVKTPPEKPRDIPKTEQDKTPAPPEKTEKREPKKIEQKPEPIKSEPKPEPKPELKITPPISENNEQVSQQTQNSEEKAPLIVDHKVNVDIREIRAREALEKEQKPQSAPVDNGEDIVFENAAPVISETVIPEASGKGSAEPKAEKSAARDDFDDLDDMETRLKIQNMTPEETMSFLAQSLSEINAPIDDEPVMKPAPEPIQKTAAKPEAAPPQTLGDYSTHPPEQAKAEKLSVEPVWGDIYIKASRSLRELCESGKLSMKQIETELNEKLLDSTRAFAEITADESKIPKVLIPKITELKAAAQNFEQYFQSGDDIAARAMFFMMYQMLSYADRIAETPETKERLNDFFRRFGPAGIMLSMLDMRV